jgi:serine O-acetyltransferase
MVNEDLVNLLPKFLERQSNILVNFYIDDSILKKVEIETIKNRLLESINEKEILDYIISDINAIFDTDPAIGNKKDKREILFYPSIKARFFHQVAHKLYKEKQFLIARAISEGAKQITNIEIHPGAKIGKGLAMDHGMGSVIGETAIIGENAIIFHGVTLGGTGKDFIKRHPTIGNNVLIGAHSQLLGAIVIGDNAKIGANSMVLQDVDTNTTVAGILSNVKRRLNKSKSNNEKSNFKLYWENYYRTHNDPFKQSSFATFVFENYIYPNRDKTKKLIELGCGNGRDSIYFAKSQEENLNILAIDQAEVEIAYLRNKFRYENLIFASEDFTNLSIVEKFDYVYSRFTLHSITEEQENNVIKWIQKGLKNEGIFFVEARSIKDDTYKQGKQLSNNENITDHYRRYMNIDDFKNKLENIGMEILYAKESKGFAIYGDSDPVTIRIIGKRIKN